MKKDILEFNIAILGVGGQGLVTLIKILSQAAFLAGFNVKTSEFHGLSQRGGSVEAHVRFGRNELFSPVTPCKKANLVLALESQEALSSVDLLSLKTFVLINNYQFPTLSESIATENVLAKLKTFTKNVLLISAARACEELFGTTAPSGVYMLGFAISTNLIPIEAENLLKAIKEVIPSKYQEININAFNMAGKEAKNEGNARS